MRSIVFFLISMISFSQNIEKDTIKVGVKLDPPFTMKYDNGHYSGLCVDLVKGIDVPYKLVEVTGSYDNIIDASESFLKICQITTFPKALQFQRVLTF